MGRLTIDITDQQHQSLKARAALQGKTIKQYALERLLPATEEDGHYIFCLWRESAAPIIAAILHERMDLVARISDRLLS